jgi:hypothetical protein
VLPLRRRSVLSRHADKVAPALEALLLRYSQRHRPPDSRCFRVRRHPQDLSRGKAVLPSPIISLMHRTRRQNSATPDLFSVYLHHTWVHGIPSFCRGVGAETWALCYRGTILRSRVLRYAGHIASIEPNQLPRLLQRCWVEGGKQPAGGIKDLYDPGLVKLRKTLDRDLRDTSDRNTWYNTIRPRALAERSRRPGSLLGNRQAECFYSEQQGALERFRLMPLSRRSVKVDDATGVALRISALKPFISSRDKPEHFRVNRCTSRH